MLIEAPTVRRQSASDTWYWNPKGRYYFNQAGEKLRAINLYQIAGDSRLFTRELTRTVDLTGEWIEPFRNIVKHEYIRQYMVARGGYEQMTAADWGRIGGTLRKQYAYLDDLFMRGEEYSTERLFSIMDLFTDSGHQMYEKAMAASYAVDLPAYPGDGDTQCLGHCRCYWDFVELEDGGLEAYWKLEGEEPDGSNCDDCLARSEEWNPLVLR